MAVSVRSVTVEDAAAMVDLLNPLIESGSYTVMDLPITVEEQVAFVRMFPEHGVFQVAVCEQSRKVVGIQDVMPIRIAEPAFRHVGEISTFVALEFHRRGVGRSLCRATFRAVEARGFRKLMATVRADNPQALCFYRSQGFRVIGTAREHVCLRGRYVDEVLLERPLDSSSPIPEPGSHR